MSRYAKAIAAFFGSISTWGIAASAEGGITAAECWGLLGVLAATFGTYQVTNTPEATDQGPANHLVQ